MPSTFSSLLRLEMMATGEKVNTWGSVNNTNLGTLLEQAVAGVASVTHDNNANYTLTTANGATDEARCMILDISGTLTANRNVVCPSSDKVYIVHNGTTGGFDITIKTAAGTGVTVENGETTIVWCDGTNVYSAIPAGLALPLAIASGGTNATTESDARDNLGLTIGTDVQAYSALLAAIAGLTPTDGNIIVGNGTTFVAESGSTARVSLGLGTAATADTGVANGNVPAMDSTGYPAANGSQITDLTGDNMATASTTARGSVEKATAAEMTAETADKYPDASTLKHSPGVAVAWVCFQTDGTIDEGYNVSSVTNSSTGIFTVNFTNNLAGTTYGALATVDIGSGGNRDRFAVVRTRSAGSVEVYTISTNGTLTEDNINNVTVVVYGALA